MIMKNLHPRLRREDRTVRAMIEIYCRHHHSSDGLCEECLNLYDYSRERLIKCPFQEGKTTCAKCPVHCYNRIMRKKIREIMRYSGPRMLYRHPVAAVRHVIDGRRKNPIKTIKNNRG